MSIRPFDYIEAESLAHAATLLREYPGEARLLAGGQTLLSMVNLGLAQPDLLIGIGDVAALRGFGHDGGDLTIGACTTYSEVQADSTARARLPLLEEAIRYVGNVRVRNRGTIGGSVSHADPAAEVPLALSVLGTRYVASDGAKSRTIESEQFTVGYYTTSLTEGELLTSVIVPLPPTFSGWGFHEYAPRAGDFAVVAAAAIATCSGGSLKEAKVGLAGVADRPVRCHRLEGAAVGASAAELDVLIDEVDVDLKPRDDPFFGADYRRHLARVLAMRALKDAVKRAEGASQ